MRRTLYKTALQTNDLAFAVDSRFDDSVSHAAMETLLIEMLSPAIPDLPVGPSPQADTVPGDRTTTATLPVGSTTAVTIDTRGDSDMYRVALTAGTTYTFHTHAAGTDNMNTGIYLYGPTGASSLISDFDSGNNRYSLFSYTPSTSGTYFLLTLAAATQTGSFFLSLAAAVTGGDSVGDTVGMTTSVVAVGTSIDGKIDTAADHDVYRISLSAGSTYMFRTGGATQATATDTILQLRSADGTVLAQNDDAGEGYFSAIRFTASSTGTYYLDVSAFAPGDFNLTISLTPAPQVFTNDQIANQLTTNYWGNSVRHFDVAPGGSISYTLTALSDAGKFLAREALAIWTDVTGIVFNEVATNGLIVFDENGTGANGGAYFVNGISTDGYVHIPQYWLSQYGTGLGSYSFMTYLHEIGHVLGLGHAGNYDNGADYASESIYLNDSWSTSVMSYFSNQENSYFSAQGYSYAYVVTPMVADALAVANLYGSTTSTRTSNTIYGFNNTSGRAIYDATQFPNVSYTVFDNGGIDTLDYSGFSQAQSINLNAETFSNVGGRVGNVSIARGTVIENAIGGSGNDTIVGNSVANVLAGGGGNDTLDGGTGVNTLLGGAGNDRLIVGTGASGTTVDGGPDTDTLVITASASLGGLSNIEAIELTPGANLTLTGTQFINGLAVNTVITGSGTITINIATPIDYLFATSMSVASTVSFVINGSSVTDVIKAANVSNTIFGGAGSDFIRGFNQVDHIDGGADPDKIIGAGGADVLTGGGGGDQFRYFAQSDSGTGAAADHITDFTSGSDTLNFAFDSDPGTPGIQPLALSYINSQAFHATGGAEVRYGTVGADLRVELDLNGDGFADMHIVLNGLAGQTLVSGDFVGTSNAAFVSSGDAAEYRTGLWGVEMAAQADFEVSDITEMQYGHFSTASHMMTMEHFLV